MRAVLILLCLSLSHAATHTLQRHLTAEPGSKVFQEYIETDIFDGEIITHYDSSTQRKVPMLTCMKDRLDLQYWNDCTLESKGQQEFIMSITEAIERGRNQTGVHTLQGILGCLWEEESQAAVGYDQFGYDGDDYRIIDVPNGLSDKDVSDINGAEPAGKEPNCIRCTQKCIKQLKMYVQHGKGCLGRKVPPEVFVFLGSVSSSAVCHATGFHPKAVNMTWKRDGEVIQEDVYVGETLPNGDGTYQKRAELTVSPEQRKRSQYTCEVEHASGLIIKTLTEPGWSSGLITGIASAITAAIFLGGLVYYFYCRGQRSSTSQAGAGSAQLLMAQPVQYRSVDPSVRVPGISEVSLQTTLVDKS